MPEAGNVRGKVPLETRIALFEALGAPAGRLTVGRRRSPDGDHILVTAYASDAVDPAQLPQEYDGFPVDFELREIPKAGW